MGITFTLVIKGIPATVSISVLRIKFETIATSRINIRCIRFRAYPAGTVVSNAITYLNGEFTYV